MYFDIGTVMHTGTRWVKRTLELAGLDCQFHPPCAIRVGHLMNLDPGPFVPVREPIRMMLSNFRDTGSEHWPRKAAALDKCLAKLENYEGRLIPIENFDWEYVADAVEDCCGKRYAFRPSENKWKSPARDVQAANDRDLGWIAHNAGEGLEWLKSKDWSAWNEVGGYEDWWRG